MQEVIILSLLYPFKINMTFEKGRKKMVSIWAASLYLHKFQFYFILEKKQ
jgi:hypothetical protein